MNFEEFIREHYEVKETYDPRHIRINCPFCNDYKFHGYINLDKGLFKCWKCKTAFREGLEAMTAAQFLVKVHGFSFRDAYKIAGNRDIGMVEGDSITESLEKFFLDCDNSIVDKKEIEYEEIEIPGEFVEITSKSVIANEALKYLRSRVGKRCKKVAEGFRVKVGISGKLLGRVIFPIFDTYGRTVWYSARDFVTGCDPKYMTPSGISKPLFGPLDRDRIYIVEGIFDMVALADSPYDENPYGVVCSFGSSLSKQQIDMIKNSYVKDVVVCFDPDNAGMTGAIKICNLIKNMGLNPYVVMGLSCDLSDMKTEPDKLYDIIKRNEYEFNAYTEVLLRTCMQ